MKIFRLSLVFVCIVFIALSATSLAHAQIAFNAADWMKVPGGLAHKTCVHQIPNGSTVDTDGHVTDNRGVTLETLPTCQYPIKWGAPAGASAFADEPDKLLPATISHA